jgi:ABC-type branched-subunit amino acid transport system permease subunit
MLGLGGGAVVAGLGVGIVLTYRASGVVNFGHAAVATFLAFAFHEFRATGDLVLPLFAVPHRVQLLPRPTVATALVVLVLYSAAIGWLLHRLVFRPLRRATPLGRVVASVGLFLYFWAVVGLDWPTTPDVRPVLGTANVTLLGRLVGVDRLVLAGLAVVLGGALWLLAHRTRFGLATTAAAENPRGAVLRGIDPDRLAAWSWVLATVLGALVMVLGVRVVPLDPLNNSLLVVPALAAALLGDFRSYPVVVGSALVIGMAQSELLNLRSDLRWLPDVGLQQGLPFLVIVVVMMFRGQGLPGRGEGATGRLPAAPAPRHVALTTAVLSVAAVALLLGGSSDWRAAVITSTVFAVLALSVVVLTGFVGQISFATYAFAGFAAFALVKVSDAGLPFPVGPVVAVALAGALGLLVGLPAVRVRGLSLAIVTLGAAVAISELLFRWSWFAGSATGATVDSPALGGLDLGIRARGDAYPRAAFGLLCVAVLLVCGLAVANLRRGPTGLRWLAVRSNERAAAACGVDVGAAKVSAFALSAALAGAGGVLLAYQRLTLSADTFGVFSSLSLLALVYLAGIGVMSGSLVAGVLAPVGILTVLTGQDVGQPSPYQFAVSGLLLVVAAVVYPDGISGAVRSAWSFVARRSTSGASSRSHQLAS